MNVKTKTCLTCKQTLSLDNFSPSGNDGKFCLKSHCKKCRAKAEANRREDPEYKLRIKRYKTDPKNKRRTKDMALRRLFGISIKDYDKMFDNQKGLCAICLRKEPASHVRTLAVDHCHITGRIRGLLCTPCNQGIGHLKDNIEILEKAIKYLKEN
jgi:hypothetical protein